MRAADLLRQADVVVTEQPEQAGLVDTDVEIVDGSVGADGEQLTHVARARLVTKLAKSGAHVVRLITGDPFTYSTCPEEAAACAKAGIGFEIVPGVSSVSAVPAYAGVPLTNRSNRTYEVVSVGDANIDWSKHVETHTLVLLSAVGRIAEVAEGLVEAGWSADTPVAMTRVGTTTDQATVVSTLSGIAKDAAAAGMASPAITVVGQVVTMRETLSWFETKPLYGWRVLVPRTKEQAAGLAARLRSYGAVGEEVPTISVEPPRNPQQIDKAVRGLVEGRYEWVAFTSVNAVKAVREKFEEYGLDARAFSGLKIAAVGDKTAEAIETWGIKPDLIPSGEQSAKGLLEDWPPYRRAARSDQPGLPPACRHRHRDPGGRPDRAGLGSRRRDGVPHGACGTAAGADPRGDQGRQVRRGPVHLQLDGAQPRRHRWQAAPVDGHRLHRTGHSQDG